MRARLRVDLRVYVCESIIANARCALPLLNRSTPPCICMCTQRYDNKSVPPKDNYSCHNKMLTESAEASTT